MTIKLAVIGAGVMGNNHLRVLSKLKNVEITGVIDSYFSLAQEASKQYNCPAYQNITELIKAQTPDAIIIAVPTKLHFEIAKEVIELGIPCLIEKPITFSSDDATKLTEIAKKKKTLVMTGHVERFNPVVIAAKKFLKTNKLGKPVSFLFRRIGLFPARVKDVNVIQDIGVHDIDLLQYLAEEKPKLKAAAAGCTFIQGRYDYCQMLFQVGTASAVIECNWITPTRVREFQIVGEKGLLKADLFNQTLEFYPTIITRDKNNNVTQMLPAIKSEQILIEKEEPLKLEIEHFLQCIKQKQQPLISIEEAAFVVQMANEVTNSLMKRYSIKKITRLLRIPDKITNKIIKQE